MRRPRIKLKIFIYHWCLRCFHCPADCIWTKIRVTKVCYRQSLQRQDIPTPSVTFLFLLVQESRQFFFLTPASTLHLGCKIHVLPCLHFFLWKGVHIPGCPPCICPICQSRARPAGTLPSWKWTHSLRLWGMVPISQDWQNHTMRGLKTLFSGSKGTNTKHWTVTSNLMDFVSCFSSNVVWLSTGTEMGPRTASPLLPSPSLPNFSSC